MNLADLSLNEAELRLVLNTALERVTPSYASARFAGSTVTSLEMPEGGSRTVVLLHISTSCPRTARGQYLPLTEVYDRGYVDEYLFGVIHGHWLATHQRDLFHEVMFVVDASDGRDRTPLYDYVPVATAKADGLLIADSPLLAAIERYGIQWVLRSGDIVSGPSPGMIATVGREVAGFHMPRVLDLFAGACCLGRVAFEHGASAVTCLDSNLDLSVATDNLGRFASRADLRDVPLAAGLIDDQFDVVAIDPFYDHTMQAIDDAIDYLEGRFVCAVINLGLDLPSTWQARIMRKVASRLVIVNVTTMFGERIAVCKRKD